MDLTQNLADVLDQLNEQMRRRPAQTAVRGPDATWTYGELDVCAGRVAAFLRSLNVTPETKVGISLPRGAFEFLAILSTLRAGGAYVPLDPAHPIDRLRMVIDDAQPAVLILADDSSLLGYARPGARLVSESELRAVALRADGVVLPSQPARPSQLQYVLYTSGSTGKPKGVEIERGAFANFVTSMRREPGFSEGDCLLAVTTTTFDIAGLELFVPLCSGGTVDIVPRDVAMDPKQLRQRLEDPRITCMQATPATWRMLIEAGWKGDSRLRLLCGGEAMSPELAARLLERCGELWNMYGPTETTVWSTLERIRFSAEPSGGGSKRLPKITIGLPIDRTQVYVLDGERRPVPQGEVGELYIGGAGLARGYHGRPDLTADKFVRVPWTDPEARIYATGDLGRSLPDGRFECLGRIDHQVKIDGHRIELGEIESVLRAVPEVQEVLVVAHKSSDEESALVAYWTGAAHGEQLRAAAKARLPHYMVPSAFISIAVFPLNTNGKIDRKALPPPNRIELPPAQLQRPQHPLEDRVASVFARVLGRTSIGRDQSFFDLGGTSILAASAIAKLDQELGTSLPLRLILENPTVASLTERLDKPGSQDEPIVIVLQKGRPEERPLLCLFGVRLYSRLALAITDGSPVVGIHVPVLYRPGIDERPSLKAIVDRYVSVVRKHQARGPYRLAGLCFGGVVAYEVARQLRSEGESVELVAILDAVLPEGTRSAPILWARAFSQRAVEQPVVTARRVMCRVRELADKRLWKPIAQTFRAPSGLPGAAASTATAPVHFSVDGPEADADIAAFSMARPHLDARVLVFRALRDPVGLGKVVDLGMGWGGLAREVAAEGVDSDHLGIMEPPYVHKVARALMREFALAKASAVSPKRASMSEPT